MFFQPTNLRSTGFVVEAEAKDHACASFMSEGALGFPGTSGFDVGTRSGTPLRKPSTSRMDAIEKFVGRRATKHGHSAWKRARMGKTLPAQTRFLRPVTLFCSPFRSSVSR